MWIIIGSFLEKCNFPWKRKFFSPPLCLFSGAVRDCRHSGGGLELEASSSKFPQALLVLPKSPTKTKVKQKVFFLQKLSWTFGVAVEGPPIFMGDPRKKQGVDEIFAFARASKGGSRWWWWRHRSGGLRTMSSRPVPPVQICFSPPAAREARGGKGGGGRR